MINNEERKKEVIIDNFILQPFERIPGIICDTFKTKDKFRVGN